MKILFFILLLCSSIKSFSQIEIDLYFYDSCNDEIKQLDFDIIDDNFKIVNYDFNSMKHRPAVVDTLGFYQITSGFSIKNDNYLENIIEFIEIKEFKNYTDTLFISNIRFVTPRALHATEWNYFNCSRLCDGFETDYYANGSIKSQGTYVKGKPVEITEFRKNGMKSMTRFYTHENIVPIKTVYFDENGLFEYYELEKTENGRAVLEYYDEHDNVIEKTDAAGNTNDGIKN